MKRPIRPEELRIWAKVAATVRPAHGRTVPVAPPEPPSAARQRARIAVAEAPAAVKAPAKRKSSRPAPDEIEPVRKRRISRERDAIDARIDLHGLGQFAAEDRLKAFLVRAHGDGLRAVLVITGKGTQGDGIIRRRISDWLADPALRDVVAGVSQAHRRHGGEGALYVALKRRTPG